MAILVSNPQIRNVLNEIITELEKEDNFKKELSKMNLVVADLETCVYAVYGSLVKDLEKGDKKDSNSYKKKTWIPFLGSFNLNEKMIYKFNELKRLRNEPSK